MCACTCQKSLNVEWDGSTNSYKNVLKSQPPDLSGFRLINDSCYTISQNNTQLLNNSNYTTDTSNEKLMPLGYKDRVSLNYLAIADAFTIPLKQVDKVIDDNNAVSVLNYIINRPFLYVFGNILQVNDTYNMVRGVVAYLFNPPCPHSAWR